MRMKKNKEDGATPRRECSPYRYRGDLQGCRRVNSRAGGSEIRPYLLVTGLIDNVTA